jgi:hypothetical protein
VRQAAAGNAAQRRQARSGVSRARAGPGRAGSAGELAGGPQRRKIMARSRSVEATNPLLGKFFHSFDSEGNVSWQGQIREQVEPGWYLVWLFEWLTGMDYTLCLVRLDEMLEWAFYDDAEEMKYAYQHDRPRPRGPVCPKARKAQT